MVFDALEILANDRGGTDELADPNFDKDECKKAMHSGPSTVAPLPPDKKGERKNKATMFSAGADAQG